MRFIIKALGDYTKCLANQLQPGAALEVEGPYGRFVPPEGNARQVWVAGGIGVTPFLAWLESRLEHPLPRPEVDFFYCVEHASQAAGLDEIQAACTATGVRLHLIESASGQRLSASMLPEVGDVWFCGPKGFAHALESGLASRGTQQPRFHTEAFAMR